MAHIVPICIGGQEVRDLDTILASLLGLMNLPLARSGTSVQRTLALIQVKVTLATSATSLQRALVLGLPLALGRRLL